MSDGLNGKSMTPFVSFMLTAVPAAIVVVAGWLFGNIFAELQHQRQRQENLVKEVTGMHRDLIGLAAQFKDTKMFFRDELLKHASRQHEIEKLVQRVETTLYTQQKERELQAIKRIAAPKKDDLDTTR